MEEALGKKKFIAFVKIFLLITSLISFSFILSKDNVVSGQDTPKEPTTGGILGKILKELGIEIPTGGTVAVILTAVQWAAVAYSVGQIIGGMLDFNKKQRNALSYSLAGGTFVWSVLVNAKGKILGDIFTSKIGLLGITKGGLISFGIGVVVATAIFLATYKDVDVDVITFECKPWQAPVGGDKCELCNSDNYPCTEYRCRSLGQNCKLVNKGTKQEKCVNIAPDDVTPPLITPNVKDLSPGLSYTNVRTSPPSPGFTIIDKNSSDGCLKAFTPLRFGITTNEPSQCKIDLNHTKRFEDMANFLGGSNYFKYNHTEKFVLPNKKAFENSSLVLVNGREMTFFLRCRDGAGNYNAAEYAVRFCIDPSPDTTPPRISATSIQNNACVAENQNNITVEFYTNEPAECRWSTIDQDYDSMKNQMSCDNKLYQLNALQLFTCRATLTGITRTKTDFYIRCADQPGSPDNERNKNKESFKFSLRGSNALKLKTLKPNGTIFGSVDPAPVELFVETMFGCNQGRSTCFYSTDKKDYILFFDTNNTDGISTQRLNLPGGNHDIGIRCVDDGGNFIQTSAKFKLDIDTSAPIIVRVYEEDNQLIIKTLRNSQCAYTTKSCDFTFQEGIKMPFDNSTVHAIEWNKKNTYYIKCRDKFRSEEADCSLIVRPTSYFL